MRSGQTRWMGGAGEEATGRSGGPCHPSNSIVLYEERVSSLLTRWSHGDRTALDRLLPLLFRDLHQMAARRLRFERSNHLLEPAALVNEVYLRLVGSEPSTCPGQVNFLRLCSRLMRNVLIDYARKQNSAKEGGSSDQKPPSENFCGQSKSCSDSRALDAALARLSALDARKGEVVKLRFFGGLTTSEIALALRVSRNTVLSDWSRSRAWLRGILG